jgi:hypothetical protein
MMVVTITETCRNMKWLSENFRIITFTMRILLEMQGKNNNAKFSFKVLWYPVNLHIDRANKDII